MKRWIILALIGLGLFVGIGFVLTLIPKLQTTASDVACKNNLREVGLFAAQNADPNANRSQVADRVPAGTIFNATFPPDQRLSWYVAVLPGFDQKRQRMDAVLAAIDRGQPWSAEQNQTAGRTKLVALMCPGKPPELVGGQFGPTSYLGIGGRGRDAPALPLLSDPNAAPDPRAGCFRYDTPTPFAQITDGLSQTLLLGEHAADLGPWLQGGLATVRGLDDAPGALLLQGAGGQFGGCHPNGANWGLADGSVRFFTDRIDPKVLTGMATIAGRDNDALPGE